MLRRILPILCGFLFSVTENGIVRGQGQIGSCDSNWEFECTTYDQCIHEGFYCDGEYDCIDNSDEPPGQCPATTCGGILNSPTGVITSPGYDSLFGLGQYPNNARCTWILQGAGDGYILIHFNRFELQEPEYRLDQGGSVCYDWLEIVDSKSDEGSIYCGMLLHLRYLAFKGSYLWLQLRSNEAITKPGFQMEYEITPCSDETAFRCSNGGCVTFLYECDGYDDCGDNSDELNCLTRDCAPYEFICAVPDNRRCIRDFEVCNGWLNCGDGADEEQNCPACAPDEYTCTAPADRRCIDIEEKCDGWKDCQDGADESNCQECASYQYTCTVPADRRCIDASEECDGWIDCADGGDEANCPECASDQYTCTEPANRRCIDAIEECDDRMDCQDGGDEANCQDPCVGITCMHGGYCVIGICVCQPGFTGSRCETVMDPCFGVFCRNGECENGFCVCQPGFTGQYCSTVVNPCSTVVCSNGGRCVDGACVCLSGFTGQYCSTVVNPCSTVNCFYGGQCEDGECICQPGYTGQNCGTVVDPCLGVVCQNGGRCDGGKCICQPEHTGQNCIIDINECLSNPCNNGGGCVDKVNAYECTCQTGYEGITCDVKAFTVWIVSSSLALEEDFKPEYQDETSPEFQFLATNFETPMDEQLKKHMGETFDKCNVTGFKSGSVITEFDVYVKVQSQDNPNPSDVEQAVKTNVKDAVEAATESGSLGRFEVIADSANVHSALPLTQLTQDECNDQGDIENGFVHMDKDDDGLKPGVKVEFSCRPGYTLHGASVSYCQADFTWSTGLPTCTEEEEEKSIIDHLKDNKIIIAVGGGGLLVLIIVIGIIGVRCRRRRSKNDISSPPDVPVVDYNRRHEQAKIHANAYQPNRVDVGFGNPGYNNTDYNSNMINDRPPVPIPRPAEALPQYSYEGDYVEPLF